MSSIEQLIKVMARLRDPKNGCPWDLKQNHQTLIPFLIEESYEVVDALEQNDATEIAAELGDLLFQVVFHARLGEERGDFDFETIAAGISAKLIRRHPHVFAGATYQDDAAREAAWDQIKAEERQSSSHQKQPQSATALSGVNKAQPALMRAQQLQRRAARVGFDWPDVTEVYPKIQEEIAEINEAVAATEPQQRVAEEVGDLLFAVVNLARHLEIDAEEALRLGNNKFERRFNAMEAQLNAKNRQCAEASLEELEAAWEQVKQVEKSI